MVDQPTEEEKLEFARSYGVEPVDVNTDLSLKEAATFVAEMTPIVGDAMAAKEIYDELMKEEPNYPLIATLGGAAVVGLIPGIGDAAASGIKKAVDVAKRVEVDPDAVGMLGGNIRIKPKVEEGTPTVEAAGLTDEAIEEWRKENATKEDFRKSLKGRNEELQEAAAGVEEGRVFTSTYRKLADDLRPIRKVTEVPKPATFVEAVSALNAGKRKKPMIGLNASIPEGDEVTARLDIDAYTDYDVWVPTLTHPELKTVYKPSVILEDVSFIKPEGREPKKALGVAKGGAKAPFAVMSGKYVNATDDDAYNIAKEAFDDPEFTQVGYDPTRRGFFYDRETGEAVVEADMVVQVGHLVLARNAKKMDAEAFSFSEGGMALEQQMEMNFGNVPDNTIGIDPVSGNEIPMGATAENVRDDIPANLSEGELVMPADVVNYWGVKLFEDLRAEAKRGYNQMAQDGRIGGEPMDDDMGMPVGEVLPFDMADLEVTESSMNDVPEDAFFGKLFRSFTQPKPKKTAREQAQDRVAAAKKRQSVNKIKSGHSSKPKFRNRAEEMLYNLRNRNKDRTGSSKPKPKAQPKTKSKAKIDFGFGGNPMERASRKYGSEAQETRKQNYREKQKSATKGTKQAYTGMPQNDEQTFAEYLNFGGKYNEGGIAYEGNPGGFGQEIGLGGSGEVMGNTMEAREYQNAAGHRIFIMFLNGEPITSIPEGYYPVGGEPITLESGVERPERDDDDDGTSGSETPVAVDYKELSVDELADMVQSNASMKGDLFASGLGIVNPVIGIAMKVAMFDQAKRTEQEIQRRLDESGSTMPIYEKEYLENLLEIAQKDKPNLLEKLFGTKEEKPEAGEVTDPEKLGMPDPEPVEVMELTDVTGKPYTPDVEAEKEPMSVQEINDMVKTAIDSSADPYSAAPDSPTIETDPSSSSYGPDIMDKVKKASKEAAEKAFTSESAKIERQRNETKEAGKKARETFEAFKNDPSNSKTIAANPDAYQRTENVIRDMERGVQRGFDKGGLVDKPKVKEVVKGLEKASKSHAKQAAKLKSALGAKKKTKKSK